MAFRPNKRLVTAALVGPGSGMAVYVPGAALHRHRRLQHLASGRRKAAIRPHSRLRSLPISGARSAAFVNTLMLAPVGRARLSADRLSGRLLSGDQGRSAIPAAPASRWSSYRSGPACSCAPTPGCICLARAAFRIFSNSSASTMSGYLNTPGAVLLGIVYGYLPLMILPIYVSLEKLDRRLLEASADLGATPLSTFFGVTLPLSLPGVMTGMSLVTILLLGEYLIPSAARRRQGVLHRQCAGRSVPAVAQLAVRLGHRHHAGRRSSWSCCSSPCAFAWRVSGTRQVDLI